MTQHAALREGFTNPAPNVYLPPSLIHRVKHPAARSGIPASRNDR